MLKDIQVTLYDIFGYLLPGLGFLAGLAISFWAVYFPTTPLSLQFIGDNWLAVAVVAYVVGHMAQAIANVLARGFPSAESLVLSGAGPSALPEALVSSAKSKASSILGVDQKNISPELLYQACDETVVQFGVTSDRDIYIYREGFYRGLAISFLLLFLSLIVRTLIPGTSLNLSGAVQPISESMLVFFALISLVGSWLSLGRYRRFGRYRVRQAIIGFLALYTKPPGS